MDPSKNDADASTNTSTDESMNENADVTKQFKLREKRIEVKENITKKFVLDSVKMRTPKRRRIVRKNGNGKQPIAGPSNATNVVNINKGDDLDSDGDSKKVQSKRRKIDGGNGVPKQSDSTSTDVGAVRAVDNGGSANLNGDDKMVHTPKVKAEQDARYQAGPSTSSSAMNAGKSNSLAFNEMSAKSKDVMRNFFKSLFDSAEPEKKPDVKLEKKPDVKPEYDVLDYVDLLSSDDDEAEFKPEAHSTKIKEEEEH